MSHQRMQPVFQNTQTERHTTQRFMNTTMQQQRNFMNSRSLLQQVINIIITTQCLFFSIVLYFPPRFYHKISE